MIYVRQKSLHMNKTRIIKLEKGSIHTIQSGPIHADISVLLLFIQPCCCGNGFKDEIKSLHQALKRMDSRETSTSSSYQCMDRKKLLAKVMRVSTLYANHSATKVQRKSGLLGNIASRQQGLDAQFSLFRSGWVLILILVLTNRRRSAHGANKKLKMVPSRKTTLSGTRDIMKSWGNFKPKEMILKKMRKKSRSSFKSSKKV